MAVAVHAEAKAAMEMAVAEGMEAREATVDSAVAMAMAAQVVVMAAKAAVSAAGVG